MRTYDVRRFATWHGGDPWTVTPDDVAGWFGQQAWAYETRRTALFAVRGFYRWAIATHRTDSDPTEPMGVMPVSPPAPRPIPDHLYREALARADGRVRLMLRLAGNSGLRRAEVAQVHTDDLIADLLGWSLLVHGKGRRDRVVPLDVRTGEELRAAPAGWVFPGADGGHLAARTVGRYVAQVLPGAWTMHSLRHRCATSMYAQSHDLLTVAQVLGHTSVDTTRRYVRTPDDARRALVDAVSV